MRPTVRQTLTMAISIEDSDGHDLDTLVPVASALEAGVTLSKRRPVLVVKSRNVGEVAVVDLTALVMHAGAAILAQRLGAS